MKKVLYVSISINPDMTVMKSKCEVKSVLKVNEKRMVLDDERFTVLNLKKEKYTAHANLDDISIQEYKDGVMRDVFGRFAIRVYSTASVKVTENRINKAFNAWLNEKIAIYGQAHKVNIKLNTK